jgi:hypothetical protein
MVELVLLALGDVAAVGRLIPAELPGHAGVGPRVAGLLPAIDLAAVGARRFAMLLPLQTPVDFADPRVTGHDFVRVGDDRYCQEHQAAEQNGKKEASHGKFLSMDADAANAGHLAARREQLARSTQE